MMVYMVHLTNQMARKAPIPNIDEVLRTNPDIARQLATAAMQQQTQSMKAAAQAPNLVQPMPPSANPLAGLSSFMGSMIPPAPQATQNPGRAPHTIKSPVKISRPNPQPPAAAVAPLREMNAPPPNIDDLLKQVKAESQPTKKTVSIAGTSKRSSTPKSTVSIKL
jgi:hypothetical protein